MEESGGVLRGTFAVGMKAEGKRPEREMFVQFSFNAPQQMRFTSNIKKIKQRRELIKHA